MADGSGWPVTLLAHSSGWPAKSYENRTQISFEIMGLSSWFMVDEPLLHNTSYRTYLSLWTQVLYVTVTLLRLRRISPLTVGSKLQKKKTGLEPPPDRGGVFLTSLGNSTISVCAPLRYDTVEP